MEDFYKVINPGTGKTNNGRVYKVYCEIRYKDKRLSISGVEGPLPSGNCLGDCGQIVSNLNTITLNKNWDTDKIRTFISIWHKWHLNDMRSECIHQREKGIKGHKYRFHICEVCGYQTGGAWQSEKIPDHVLDFLKGLPESDNVPAWI